MESSAARAIFRDLGHCLGSVWLLTWETCLTQAAFSGVQFWTPAVLAACLSQALAPRQQANTPLEEQEARPCENGIFSGESLFLGLKMVL
jgi:hypothetical protein